MPHICGLSINDVTHYLIFLTPPSPLSPILLNRFYGVKSPFGRPPSSQVTSFMDDPKVRFFFATDSFNDEENWRHTNYTTTTVLWCITLKKDFLSVVGAFDYNRTVSTPRLISFCMITI